MSSFEDKVKKAIPAEFHMISGSQDSQTSADVYNTSAFQLPNPAGTSQLKNNRSQSRVPVEIDVC